MMQDYIGRHTTVVALLYIYSTSVIAAGSGALVGLYPALVLYAIIWGGLSGSFFTITPPMMADMVDNPQHAAWATAFIFSLAGCGFVFGEAAAKNFPSNRCLFSIPTPNRIHRAVSRGKALSDALVHLAGPMLLGTLFKDLSQAICFAGVLVLALLKGRGEHRRKRIE